MVLHEPLSHAISAESLRKISAFSAQSLSNTAWSYAVLALTSHEPLFAATSASAIAMLCESETQNLANGMRSWRAMVALDMPVLTVVSEELFLKV